MPILPIGTDVGGIAGAFRAGQRDAILLRQARQQQASQAALSDFLTQNTGMFSQVSPEIARILDDPNIDPATRLQLANTFSSMLAQRRQLDEPGAAEQENIRFQNQLDLLREERKLDQEAAIAREQERRKTLEFLEGEQLGLQSEGVPASTFTGLRGTAEPTEPAVGTGTEEVFSPATPVASAPVSTERFSDLAATPVTPAAPAGSPGVSLQGGRFSSTPFTVPATRPPTLRQRLLDLNLLPPVRGLNIE